MKRNAVAKDTKKRHVKKRAKKLEFDPPPVDLWKTLPQEVWCLVFDHLGMYPRLPRSFMKDMSHFSGACRAFREAALRYVPWRCVLDIMMTTFTGIASPDWYRWLYRAASGRGKKADQARREAYLESERKRMAKERLERPLGMVPSFVQW